MKKLFLLFYVTFIFAQGGLTLDRIYNSWEFSEERFSRSKWLDDNSGYVVIEKSKAHPDFKDLVLFDRDTGEKSIILSAERLIPEGQTEPLSIYNYKFSNSNKYVLIFTNTERVWRYHTRGDYWILNLETNDLKQLGKDLPESSLMFTKLSPDEDFAAYVSKNNIYVEEIATGNITQVTKDGCDYIINGTTDWVYEEELSLRDAFRWSPDGEKIAFLQFDTRGVGTYFMLNTTDSIYSKPIPVEYPKAGTTNSSCKLAVVNIEDLNVKFMNVEGDPRNNYIARLEWIPESNEVMIQHLNRLQNKNRITYCDAETGSTKVVYTDEDEAWLDYCTDVVWMNDNKEFTWITDRNGWKQIIKISRDGKNVTDITPAEFDVVSVEKINVEKNLIYFIASPESATERYLFKADLNGDQDIEKISPDEEGIHSYQISDDGTRAIHSFSNSSTPRVVELVSLPDHETLVTHIDNKKLKEDLAEINFIEKEFFKVDIGEVELDAWMIKPNNIDESKKYPVLFFVYGEPAGQTVLNRFDLRSDLWYQLLTEKGYIIISVDNRGTPGPRGHDFRKSIYKKIGLLSSQDQAAAAKKIMEMFKFVDPDRIGIWGWSGGGSMTLNMLFRYPEIYKVGMSVAPVSNQRYYDTIYQERYMGNPNNDPEAYKKGSPITFAHQLEGKLLLVHGTGDDNVHYQNAEAVINKLVEHGKQFTMFAYPNRGHGIYEGKGTSFHLRTLLTNFLFDNLTPGGK